MRMKVKSGREGGGGGVEEVMDMCASQLREVKIDDVGYLLKLAPMPDAFRSLSTLQIHEDNKVENLREVEDVFRNCSSSLQELEIRGCSKLMSVSGALQHLTALHTLAWYMDYDIIRNDDMTRCRIEEEDELQWSALRNCLHRLNIDYVPKGIRHLTSLQSLSLRDHGSMKSIPDLIASLSSLKSCFIRSNYSEELRQRCKCPDGPDWPKIQHIPSFQIWGWHILGG